MFARSALIVLLCCSVLGSTTAEASDTASKGEIRFENRFFNDDNLSSTEDFGYGFASRLEVDNSSGDWNSRAQLFARVDRKDRNRQRLNIEELFTQWVGDQWVWFAGFKTLNWSTAEAFHPSDVINSRNFDGPIENAEKLGEMMIGGQYLSESLNVSAFFMPTLARPQLPASTNRLAFAPRGVAVTDVQFVSNDGEIKESNDFAEQWAAHVQLPLDDLEINFYWVHHFDRTDFRTIFNPASGAFVPLLSEVDHYAINFQYVWEAWIFKSENVYRNFQETTNVSAFQSQITREDYGLSSLALEYMLSYDSGADTSFIVEYQTLYGVADQVRYNINPFQRDILVGARHSFNDIKGREFFVGVIADVERSREILASFSYAQRLSDVWKLQVGGRYIDAAQNSAFDLTGMRPLNNDHQLDINLSRFF